MFIASFDTVRHWQQVVSCLVLYIVDSMSREDHGGRARHCKYHFRDYWNPDTIRNHSYNTRDDIMDGVVHKEPSRSPDNVRLKQIDRSQ